MEKCKRCSTHAKSVYHSKKCPFDDVGPYIWVKNKERPIEKADRFLKQYCGEKDGAKGWI
jgi:hypothetical protein